MEAECFFIAQIMRYKYDTMNRVGIDNVNLLLYLPTRTYLSWRCHSIYKFIVRLGVEPLILRAQARPRNT